MARSFLFQGAGPEPAAPTAAFIHQILTEKHCPRDLVPRPRRSPSKAAEYCPAPSVQVAPDRVEPPFILGVVAEKRLGTPL